MRWKLFYNFVAVTALAGSYAQLDNIYKNLVEKPDRNPILYTSGQHLPTPAELLKGYVPPTETDKTTKDSPTTVLHNTPFLVEEENPTVATNKDQPDNLDNEIPKLPPVQVSDDKTQTTTAKNYRTPRQLNFDSTTPSVTSTPLPGSIDECFDTTTSSSVVSTQESNIDSDLKLPTPPSPQLPPLPPSPPPRLPPSSKPSVPFLPTRSPSLWASPTQSTSSPPQITDHIPSTNSPISIPPGASIGGTLEPVKYPFPPRIPPPRYFVIPNQDSAFNHPTSKPSLTVPPSSSKSITYPNKVPLPPQSFVTPRLPLPIPSTSPTPSVSVTSEVFHPTFEVTSNVNTTPKLPLQSSSTPPSLPSKPLPPSQPLPPLPPSQPLPSLPSSRPLLSLPPSQPWPSLPPSRPLPSLPPTKPLPSLPPSQPLPSSPPSQPLQPLPPSRPLPSSPPSQPLTSLPPPQPLPPLPPSRPLTSLPPIKPLPSLPPSQPLPSLPPSQALPPLPPSRPFPPLHPSQPLPSLPPSQPLPPLPPSRPLPSLSPSQPLPSLQPSRPLPSLPPSTPNNKAYEITTLKPKATPVNPNSSPPPRFAVVPNPKPNNNNGNIHAEKPCLSNTPLPYDPINDPNLLHPSLPPRVSPSSKLPLPLPTTSPAPSVYVTPDTSPDITTSQTSSEKLPLPSKPLTPHPSLSLNPPTSYIPPSRLPMTPNPIPTLRPHLIATQPAKTASTFSPALLPPSSTLRPQPLPLQITPEISTHKPDLTIIYPDQSIIIPPPSPRSVKIAPSPYMPTEKPEPEPIIPNKSPSTVTPKCVQRYAYLKVEGSSDSYFECQDYQPTYKRCRKGLYYNPNLEWPKYPCDANEVKKGEITSEYGPIPSPNGIDKYRMVVNGYYYEMTCPQGLNFNPISARCDWPLQVSCNSDVSLGFKCPTEGVDESGNPIVINYKYEGSCTLFYSCQAGYARVLSCRPGHAFSTISGRCEEADKVVCENYNVKP